MVHPHSRSKSFLASTRVPRMYSEAHAQRCAWNEPLCLEALSWRRRTSAGDVVSLSTSGRYPSASASSTSPLSPPPVLSERTSIATFAASASTTRCIAASVSDRLLSSACVITSPVFVSTAYLVASFGPAGAVGSSLVCGIRALRAWRNPLVSRSRVPGLVPSMKYRPNRRIAMPSAKRPTCEGGGRAGHAARAD